MGMKRLGKFSKERAKPRTLLVTVSTEHETRMILAKSFENRDKLVNENFYLTYALTKEALKQSLCLKRGRELFNGVMPREELKIRNFELFNSNNRVDLKSNDFVGPESSSRLYHMNVLQIIARNLLNYEGRFLLSNAISLCQPAVICIYETWVNNNIIDSELLFSDYLIFRSDGKSTEDKNPYGGTFIAIENALNRRRLELDDVDNCAIFEIQVNKSKVFIFSFYNPPKTSPYQYSIEGFEKILSWSQKTA